MWPTSTSTSDCTTAKPATDVRAGTHTIVQLLPEVEEQQANAVGAQPARRTLELEFVRIPGNDGNERQPSDRLRLLICDVGGGLQHGRVPPQPTRQAIEMP